MPSRSSTKRLNVAVSGGTTLASGNGLELVERVAVECQQRGRQRGELILGCAWQGGGAPRADELLAVEEAEREVRVADVDGEQLHAALSYQQAGALQTASVWC